MEGQPQIHFIDAPNFKECEIKVNEWINQLEFVCSVLNINVLPMILDGKLVFLGVVTYTKAPSYMHSNKPGEIV